jgi:signal transduction histidine kinase
MQARSHIKVDVDVDPEVAAALSARSHDDVQLTREALSNVGRHAQARRASVSLSRRDSKAVLTIDDDGIGFDASRPDSGNGLRNMRERAAGLQGDLSIKSSPGKGTSLRISFPV